MELVNTFSQVQPLADEEITNIGFEQKTQIMLC